MSTGRPVAAPSALPVPRAIAIAVAGTILVLAVLFAVAVGTIMRQRMNAAPEPSGSLATPPVVDLAPELGPASSSSPALEVAVPDAAAEIDAGLVTDAATPSDASSPDADADAAPKPPVRKRWYRKKRRTSSTAK